MTEATVARFEHRRTTAESIQHFLHRFPTMVPVIVLIVSVAGFALAAPNFMSAFNLSLILQQVAVVGTLAAAQSLVILTAGIDLSVSAVMVLCSVIMGKLAVEIADAGTAVAVLDRRTVFVSMDAIDMTQDLVSRLNAELGDGAGTVPLNTPVPN